MQWAKKPSHATVPLNGGSPGLGGDNGVVDAQDGGLYTARQRHLEWEELVLVGAETQATVPVLPPREQVT
jgi:hypothetical protein